MTKHFQSPIGLIAEARVEWLSALPATGPLPERTVIVGNEATAHAWRREIVDVRPDLLLGTQFVTPIGAAIALLERDDNLTFSSGEEAVRAARIVTLLRGGIDLEGFDLTVLREARGWGDALASTLDEIEGAGLSESHLAAQSDPRMRDLAKLLRRLDEEAGWSWTTPRILREAEARLVADPRSWPFRGACLIEATGHEDVAMARWLRAVPGARIVSIATQPRRTSYVERVRARFGELALQEVQTRTTNELGLLATYLFSTPEVLADTDRPRSPGNDGTVHLEEHAGLEDELDAAVSWLIGEIAELGTPLEQIGIVVPRLDPYAALLSTRIEVLIPDSVCVLGGVPATSTSGGARIAMLLNALAGYLHIDVLSELLPILELPSEKVFVSRADAIETMYSLGTVGGSAAHPVGALEWLPRVAARRDTLARQIADASKDDDRTRDIRSWKRILERLEMIGGPLEAVDRVMRILLADGSLADLWPAVKAVLGKHLRVGAEGTRIVAALDEALRPLSGAGVVFGGAALGAIESALGAVRLPVGRFGEPRVTIAALGDVGGLTFRSVRILGLAEGTVPSTVREDPVLPDSARRALGVAMPLASDRSIAQLHSLHRIILGATERVVLSVARMDPERRYREPSGVMLEAAAAIGRPPLGMGGLSIPSSAIMHEQAFAPARRELSAVRARWPVHTKGQLDRAVRRRQVPKAWTADRILALDRLLAPASPEAGAMDGWFTGAFPPLPGLTSDRPLSASALARLLECPHRFLYERVLGWDAPPAIAKEGTIDALSYGSLFHATAEAFYREHGKSFSERARSIDEWRQIASTLAAAAFDRFVETYPLTGDGIRGAAKRRLQRDLGVLLERDWNETATFEDVERRFGPLALPVGTRVVHVHGVIDRIDRSGTVTLIRDLKTGRAKRRKDADDIRPAYDVQLGVYGLVAEANAVSWDLPPMIEGAYVYPADESGDERSFREDFSTLMTHTRSWLTTALDLLEGKRFPRTPNSDDCTYCPFKPVCGPAAQERAHDLLETPDASLTGFAALKLEDDDGEA